jgi:oxygen-dependent protoporphyrinogen oxidase
MPKTQPGRPAQTYFMSFRGGMQELPDAIADAAGRDRLLTGKRVMAIERVSGDTPYLVRLAGGETFPADAVIISAEAYQAARFLSPLDAQVAAILDQTAWTSAATVSLAYRQQTVGPGVRGWGFLVPHVAKRRIMASTFSSIKWLGRAPDGYVLIRAFVGGPHNGPLVDLDDPAMVAMVRDELRTILGVSAEPEFARVYRWHKAMPQYTLGHLTRLGAAERRLEDHPGLYLCGASYRGVGMGDCMHTAEEAVAKAIALVTGHPLPAR